MKAVLQKVAVFMFWLFALVAFGLMVSLTYSAILKIFPGDQIKAVWGISMFDVACVVWLMVFAFKCEGMAQRAGALINFILALAGTLGMVSLEVLVGGQGMVNVDARLGENIVYLFIGITVANLVGIYFHHLTEPVVNDEIEQRAEVDKITAEARNQANEAVRAALPQLGRVIAARYVDDVYSRLRLVEGSGQIIDAQARDVVEQPVAAQAKPKSKPWAFLGKPAAQPAPQNDLSGAIPVTVPTTSNAKAYVTSATAWDGDGYRGLYFDPDGKLVYTTPDKFSDPMHAISAAVAAMEGGGKTENHPGGGNKTV